MREGYLRISETNVDFEESIIETTDKKPAEKSLVIPKMTSSVTAVPSKFRDLRNDVNIVATIPERLKDLGHAVQYKDLSDAFSELLHQANKTIRLSLPFLEPNGIWIFLDDIVTAASKGVEFRLLTRETYEPKKNIAWVRKIKALIKMIEIIRRYGPRGEEQMKIRDFHTTLVARNIRYQFESSHAKLLIVDEITAYVGSGEWRENSLFYNFELGVILNGPIVHVLTYLYDIIWENSKETTYEILKNRLM